MNYKKYFLNTFVVAFAILSVCEARGGRRGGSFGGLFGSWRKYKKASNGGGVSRRIVSSSPMHTPITKAWHDNKKVSNGDNLQKLSNSGYPRGTSYYQNSDALPGNVIYVPQTPPRGAEIHDFLNGYITGRLLTIGFPSTHYQNTHVYREYTPASATNENSKNISQVVVISGQQGINSKEAFNTSVDDYITMNSTIAEEANSTTMETPLSTVETPTQTPLGIICIPMLINETISTGETVQNERTVCYPASTLVFPQKNVKSETVEIAGDIMEQ